MVGRHGTACPGASACAGDGAPAVGGAAAPRVIELRVKRSRTLVRRVWASHHPPRLPLQRRAPCRCGNGALRCSAARAPSSRLVPSRGAIAARATRRITRWSLRRRRLRRTTEEPQDQRSRRGHRRHWSGVRHRPGARRRARPSRRSAGAVRRQRPGSRRDCRPGQGARCRCAHRAPGRRGPRRGRVLHRNCRRALRREIHQIDNNAGTTGGDAPRWRRTGMSMTRSSR